MHTCQDKTSGCCRWWHRPFGLVTTPLPPRWAWGNVSPNACKNHWCHPSPGQLRPRPEKLPSLHPCPLRVWYDFKAVWHRENFRNEQICWFTNASKAVLTPDVTHLDVEKAGEQALISIYGGISGSDLNFTRASKFTEKVVASSSYIPPERLPPTSDAARFHSQRVYLQVQAWLGISLNPTEWGWSLHKSNRLKPRRMEQSAPASLLKIIRCNCTRKCDKNTCSCRKNGLLCTMAVDNAKA